METSLLNQWFSGHQINAICWTLIHSLWIGMIIALLAGIIISVTRKSAATLRYSLLCAVLVLFAVAIGITYSIELRSNPATRIAAGGTKFLITITNAAQIHQVAGVQNQNFLDRTQEFLNQNMSVIFLVWALFFVFKSLKMISGLLYIQRIRNYKVHPVAEEFKHKIEMFSSQIGIRQTVCLVQSELVKVPVAVGWLKPLILLPMGIILQLSTEQLDSILWHELAHIRRRDYLVNILQGLVETVFFFNPGLLWLSSLIRAEREACCDDIVLSRLNRKANYLEALLSFSYQNKSRTVLAMSIGSGNQLRDRLKRMINQENKRLNMAEKVVPAAGLILLLAFTTLPKTAQAVRYLSHLMTKKSVAEAISKPAAVKPAVVPKPLSHKPQQFVKDTIIKKTDTAVRFTSILFNKSDSDLYNNEIRATDDKGNRYRFVIADNKLVAMDINDIQVKDNELAGYGYMVRYIDEAVAEKRRTQEEDIVRREKANWPAAKFKSKDSIDFAKRKYVYGQEAGDINLKLEKWKLQTLKGRWRDDSINYATQRQRAHNVIADLVQEKVVPNAAAVKWFGLSNTELIVNGQEQPGALQQKLKAKYGIHQNYGLYYGPVQMNGTGVFINDDARDRFPPPPALPPGKPLPPGRIGLQQQKGTLQMKQMKALKQLNDSARFTDQQARFAEEVRRQKDEQLKAEHEAQMEQLNENARLAEEVRRQKDERLKAEHEEEMEQLNNNAQLAGQIRRQKEELLRADHPAAWSDQQGMLMTQRELTLLKAQHSHMALQPVISNIMADLVTDNVVKDRSDLSSFKLTNTFLTVNGVKQPEDLHQKLKAKYLDGTQYDLNRQIIGDPDFGFHYDAKNGDMGIGISINKNDP